MTKLIIEFDYDNGGFAHDGSNMNLDRQYRYDRNEGVVYSGVPAVAFVDSEDEARDAVEWDIVRNWPAKYAALYMFRFMPKRRSQAVRIMEIEEAK